MGILTRMADIMSANINALLDKAENPEKMVDQYLRKALEDLAEVKEETAEVVAAEMAAKRQLDRIKGDIAKYNKIAEQAVMAGDDNDATIALGKVNELEAQLAGAQKLYDTAAQNSANMRKLHNKLTNDVASLKARRDQVKTTMKVADAQKKINNVAKASRNLNDVNGAFARIEQKAESLLDVENAIALLDEEGLDPAASLEAKYGGASSPAVNDKLAELKLRLGK